MRDLRESKQPALPVGSSSRISISSPYINVRGDIRKSPASRQLRCNAHMRSAARKPAPRLALARMCTHASPVWHECDMPFSYKSASLMLLSYKPVPLITSGSYNSRLYARTSYNFRLLRNTRPLSALTLADAYARRLYPNCAYALGLYALPAYAVRE